LDINGQYEKGKPFVGALGGQLMQLILAIQAIQSHDIEIKTEESSKQPSIDGGKVPST
jgi:hypothetical protein